MKRVPVFILLSLFLSAPAVAEVYRWVDEDGRVHFGDRPPPKTDVKTVDVDAQSPAAPAATAVERREKQRRLLEMYENERQRKAERQRETQQAERERARDCARAKDIWQRYTRASGIYDVDGKGERQFLSHEERREEEQRARAYVERFCGEDPQRAKSESR